MEAASNSSSDIVVACPNNGQAQPSWRAFSRRSIAAHNHRRQLMSSPACTVHARRPCGRRKLGDELVETYAGPDRGVATIKAEEWQPFIRTMPHSEYPSASSCICEVI